MPTYFRNIFGDRPGDLRGKISGIYGVLIAANLLAWGWALASLAAWLGSGSDLWLRPTLYFGLLLLPVAALFAVLNPGSADSAPLTVTVLGQTAETPPASCPGKIVNNVEITPCRVEGHVSGFQSIADGIAKPYEAPYEGKIVAWSITLAKPSSTETETTTNEIAFFNDAPFARYVFEFRATSGPCSVTA